MARTNNEQQVTGWVGWIYFAGFLLLIEGFFQITAGLVALLNDQFYAVIKDNLVVFDVTTWGWIHLFLGLLILVVGTSLFSGHLWARVVAMVLVIMNIIGQFVFINAYPIWSIISIIIGVLILYALTVHGAETELE